MNRLERIKAYKENKDKENDYNISKEMEEYYKLMAYITSLRPRIAELIETANACLENGIEINKYRCTHSDYDNKYERGTFVSNAITHKVGFIQGNGCSFGYNKRTPITMMGIVNGGMNGCYDLHTNGLDAYYHCDGKIVKADNRDLLKFVNGFNKFEKAFYEYVDRVVDR